MIYFFKVMISYPSAILNKIFVHIVSLIVMLYPKIGYLFLSKLQNFLLISLIFIQDYELLGHHIHYVLYDLYCNHSFSFYLPHNH